MFAPEVKSKHAPNMLDYEAQRKDFSWVKALEELDTDVQKHGLNIAYEAIDKHCEGSLKNLVALRWINKDSGVEDFTYGSLQQKTNAFANLLKKLGIKKGETVYTLTGRIPALYVTALGSLKYTAVYCPLFSVFGPEPILQRLKSGDARVLVTTTDLYDKKVKGLLDQLSQLKYILLSDADEDVNDRVLAFDKQLASVSTTYNIPFTDPETPALLHFTSGTTGMPKGALHVHEAVLMHYVTGKYVLDFHPDDVFWCTADPGWVTGTSYGIIAPLVYGVTNIVDEAEYDSHRWYEILQDQKVNVWYTAPTAIRRLMRNDFKPMEKYNLEHLRLILSVGEPLNPEAVVWGKKVFNMPILDNWWQTETGGIMIANYRSMEVKAGAMGKPLPGVTAAIAEINDTEFKLIDAPNKQGHLVIKKGWPSMFRAYINQKDRYENSFHDDWYISGDLATLDEDGYFWFIGRADDIIKTSGHMVGPFEVESCLMEHPAVAESAVIGKPEPMIGQLVKAFVVLKSGYEGDDKLRLDIMAHARKKLGPAVAPKEIEFTDSLPKTRSGKIMRRLLKARDMGEPEGDTSTLEN